MLLWLQRLLELWFPRPHAPRRQRLVPRHADATMRRAMQAEKATLPSCFSLSVLRAALNVSVKKKGGGLLRRQ